MPESDKFLDAFIAVMQPDGAVVTGDILDPTLKNVLVVEFRRQNDYFTGVYNNEQDCWEIFGSDRDQPGAPESYGVVRAGNELYELAEQTILHFKDTLSNNPSYGALSARMAKEIIDEMDNDFLRSCRAVKYTTVKPTIISTPYMPYTNRKLTARWTTDKLASGRFVVKSRLLPGGQ